MENHLQPKQIQLLSPNPKMDVSERVKQTVSAYKIDFYLSILLLLSFIVFPLSSFPLIVSYVGYQNWIRSFDSLQQMLGASS